MAQKLKAELLLDEADLRRAVVLGGEAELEELVADELFRGPPVGVHVAGVAGLDAGHRPGDSGPPGGVQAHRAEGTGFADAQGMPLAARARPARELRVGPIEVEQVLALCVEDERAHALAFGAAAEQRHSAVGLQELVEDVQRVRGLGRDARDTRDREVPPGAAVHEPHVGVDGLAPHVQANRELAALHLVLEQGDRAVHSHGAHGCGARVRRDEYLGDDAQHPHLRQANMLGGHDAIDDPGGVGGQVGAFEAAAQLGDDPVVRDLRPVGELVADGDQLVQLDVRVRVEDHLEVARTAAVRAVHQPDPGVRNGASVLVYDRPAVLVVHVASSSRLCCMTASRTARSASRESPNRW